MALADSFESDVGDKRLGDWTREALGAQRARSFGLACGGRAPADGGPHFQELSALRGQGGVLVQVAVALIGNRVGGLDVACLDDYAYSAQYAEILPLLFVGHTHSFCIVRQRERGSVPMLRFAAPYVKWLIILRLLQSLLTYGSLRVEPLYCSISEREHMQKSLLSRHFEFGIWMFDLDDTLMWNCTTYNQPIIDFIQYLTEVFGNRIPSLGTMARIQEDIDCGLGKKPNPRTGELYGFGADRFPDSLMITYRQLCTRGFGTYDANVAERCREIGKRAFDVENYSRLGLVPGAQELLDAIPVQHHQVLVTKGEKWVQENKINALGFRDWFDDIFIVDHKDGDTYRDILSSLRAKAGMQSELYVPENCIAVGNSFSSDIAPALALGMNAIFIPCPTWIAESVIVDELSEDASSRFVELENISEIHSLISY